MANDPSTQTRLEFQLFGGAALIPQRSPTSAAIKSRKGHGAPDLFGRQGRAYAREEVADLLWDTTSTAQSLSNLRTVLAGYGPSLATICCSSMTRLPSLPPPWYVSARSNWRRNCRRCSRN